MESKPAELAWNYLTELRKELVDLQKTRAQIIGFKILAITAIISFAGNASELDPTLLCSTELRSDFL